MIELKKKKGVKDKDAIILTLCLTLLAQFYTVKVNGEKFADIIKKQYNIIMNEETLNQFNEELKALLGKYNVALTVEEVPATKRIVVIPNEAPKEEKTEDAN